MTTGGTESILMACKAYRDYAREVHGITKPNMVIPTTAHSAFDKAAKYLNIFVKAVPVNPETTQADVKKMEQAINKNTVMVSVPHTVLSIFSFKRNTATLVSSLLVRVQTFRMELSTISKRLQPLVGNTIFQSMWMDVWADF